MFANPTLQRTVRKIRENIFQTLSVDLNSVQAHKWNSERVTIFKSVILQHDQGINNSKHICAHILLDSTDGIVGHLTNSWKTHLTQLWDTWGNFAGSKPRSNIIIRSRNFSWKENFVRKSYLSVHGKWGEFYNPKHLQRIEQELLTNSSHWYWRENTHTKIPSCATLEMYNKKPIFIPVNITENAVESVAWKILGASGP